MPTLQKLLGTHTHDAIATVIVFLATLLLRSAAIRFVRHTDWANSEAQLRLMVQIRWATVLILSLGLVIIWASELRSLALSVVAIAAALVLALKELILCASGSFFRATSGCYTIGNRIEIDGIRGDVIDVGPLSTTILETGPGHRRTGRAVALPNSLLLSKPVINESFTDNFVLHTLSVPVAFDDDWPAAEQRLLRIANDVCSPFLAEARGYMNRTAERHGLPQFTVEPTVSVQVPEATKLNLILRMPTPSRDKGHIEQQVLRRFLTTSA